MRKIIHVVDIKVAPALVFKALNSVEGLASWWTKEVSGECRADGIIDFTFLDGFNPDMKITGLKKDEKIEWTCVSGHDLWKDHTFQFNLDSIDTGTTLTFTQNYTTEVTDDQFGRYNYNWGYYLQSLKDYCETGEGKPFIPVE